MLYLDDDTAFLDKLDELNTLLKANEPRPSERLTVSKTEQIINEPTDTSNVKDPRVKEVGGDTVAFAHEYSVSGWFKWVAFR